jgi:hypothetical protein
MQLHSQPGKTLLLQFLSIQILGWVSRESLRFCGERLTLSTHWTLSLRRVLLDPFNDTVLQRSVIVLLMSDALEMLSSPCGSCGRICQTLRNPNQSGHRKHAREENLHRLQSSPGYLHVGHVPSKCTWQIPHTSSSGISHLHVATAFHFRIVTFMFPGHLSLPVLAEIDFLLLLGFVCDE